MGIKVRAKATLPVGVEGRATGSKGTDGQHLLVGDGDGRPSEQRVPEGRLDVLGGRHFGFGGGQRDSETMDLPRQHLMRASSRDH